MPHATDGGNKRNETLARADSLFLVVLTAVLAFASVPALFLRSQLLDTDRYVATVAPLASDPAIQAEITDQVTTRISEATDIEGMTRDALAELGKTAPLAAVTFSWLAPGMAAETKTMIRSAVSRFVAGSSFENLWIRANRVGHQGLSNLVAEDSAGAVDVDRSGTVTISAQPIIAGVKAQLIEQGMGIASTIPEVEAQIILLQSPELGRAAVAVKTLDRAAPVLPGLAVFSALGAIMVAPRGQRLRATSRVGWGVAGAMAALTLAVAVGAGALLSTVPAGTVSPAAAQTLVEALLAPLRTAVRFVFAASLLLAAAALLGGQPRPARAIRLRIARTGDVLTARAAAAGVKPWQRSLARFRQLLAGGIAAGAALLLILWPNPTASAVLWTVALAGLGILLIELLCRPAVKELALRNG